MIGNEPVPVPGQKLAAFNNVPASTTSPSPSIMTSPPQCDQCQKLILDRFVCFVMSRPYHPRCLACSDCGSQLMDRCFAKMGRLYCRSDFLKYVLLIIYVSKQLSLSLALKKSNISQLLILSISLPFFNNMFFFLFFFCLPNRRFGARCGACSQAIDPSEMVRRTRNRVFHLQCFACCVCHRALATGDELYMADENRFVCRQDFLAMGPPPSTVPNQDHQKSGQHPAPMDNSEEFQQQQRKLMDPNGTTMPGLLSFTFIYLTPMLFQLGPLQANAPIQLSDSTLQFSYAVCCSIEDSLSSSR